MPFINEAVWALHDGVAEAEAIDTIAKLGFAHPMGPLALADLIGLDTCVAIMEVLHHGLGDERFAPSEIAILVRMNAQLAPIEEALTREGIAYQVRGVRFYDRPDVKAALAAVLKRIIAADPFPMSLWAILEVASPTAAIPGTKAHRGACAQEARPTLARHEHARHRASIRLRGSPISRRLARPVDGR